MVRLLDGADGPFDSSALLGRSRAGGQRIPHSTAEVGAPGHRIERDREHQHGRDERYHRFHASGDRNTWRLRSATTTTASSTNTRV